jgi:imidazolonepropionase-like amidohydrolase
VVTTPASIHVARLALVALAIGWAFAANAATAFVNANVIPMNAETVLAGQTVIVRDGRIAAIDTETELDGIDHVIDATDHYLIPGLAEMHAHVPPPEESAYLQDVLWLWLLNGVTTIRGVLGHDSHLQLRDELETHRVAGPRFYASGPSLRGTTVDGPDHARERVREQHAAGYDLIKLHPGLGRDEFDAIADEARRVGIDIVGHVSLDVGLRHALASGQRTIEHLDGYVHALVDDAAAHGDAAESFFGVNLMPHVERDRIPELVQATRDAGAWLVPTETLFENVATPVEELMVRPELRYLPRELLARYERSVAAIGANPHLPAMLELRKSLIGTLHDAGVPILLGSDSPQIFNVPGFSIHRELEAMVAAGLSPFQALVTGTVNPARHFDNNAGTLEVGRDADIVMLRANPLDDIRNSSEIAGVMVRGHWYDAEQRNRVLDAIANRHAAEDGR